jgi:hypothetical protein
MELSGQNQAPAAVRGSRRMWRRRWGVVYLGLSLLMVVLGLTAFERRLKAGWFLLYWFSCAMAASFAMVLALLEAMAVRIQLRREQRALMEASLREIQEEARRRSAGNGWPPSSKA